MHADLKQIGNSHLRAEGWLAFSAVISGTQDNARD
jgi:hypothetical protein